MNKKMVQFLTAIFLPIVNPIRTKLLEPLVKLSKAPQELIKKLQELLGTHLHKKETSAKDYIKLYKYLISKKLLAVILLILFSAWYFAFIKPPAVLSKLTGKAVELAAGSKAVAAFSGSVKLYNDNGTLKYEGSMAGGEYSGEGVLYDENGKPAYSGQFDKGAPNGQGIRYDKDGTVLYKGEFKDNTYSGNGICFYPTGKARYEGEFKNGSFDGNGVGYFQDGTVQYEGAFVSGSYHGQGKLFSGDKKLVYEGNFVNGIYSGDGTEYYPNGNVKYNGSFLNGLCYGTGSSFYQSGKKLYEGSYFQGLYNEQGKLYSEAGGLLYEGSFKEGKYDGPGTLYNDKGEIAFKGYFKDSKPDYLQFFTVPADKLRELLGEPSETLVISDSSVELVYKNLNLSFILELSADDPENTAPAAVCLSGSFEVLGIDSTYDPGSLSNKLGKPAMTQEGNLNGINCTVYTYLKDGYVMDFYWDKPAKKLLRLELRQP